jgi:hypothetical protein
MTELLVDKKQLREKHVAWARARLRSPAGKAALRTNLEAGFRAIMRSRVEQVLDEAAALRVLERVSTDPFLSQTLKPLVRAAILIEAGRLREEPARLSVYVSDEARVLIERILERPGLLPEKFVRQMLSHQAFEEISRDVLDGALHEFGDKVNPFTAEWGLPSLLKKAGPLSIGLGAFKKSLDSVREEFDRRLEPERKRFLQGFARRALGMVAEFMIKRNDDKEFVALRKELFAWLLDQPVEELVAPMTGQVAELVHDAAHAIAQHTAAMDATKRRRKAALDMIMAAHAKQTVEQALEAYGAKLEPDFDALTDALWPIVLVGLDAPEVDAFVDDIVGGFYDE